MTKTAAITLAVAAVAALSVIAGHADLTHSTATHLSAGARWS